MRLAVVSVACAVAVAASAQSAVGSSPFRQHAVTGQGMSLAVPATWVVADAGLSRAAIEKVARDNPALSPYLGQLLAPTSPMKFLALDPIPRSGFASNVNVVGTATPTLSFKRYREAIVSEIRSIVGTQPIDDRAVTIGGVRAVRVSYRLKLNAGRPITVQTLQYAFPRPGRSVVVTYTTLPKHQSRYATTFARSAASIRFT